jgi:hypothetical protein
MKADFADRLAMSASRITIEAVERFASELHDWEKEHIESFKARLEQGRPLTPGQVYSLNGIYDRRVKPPKAEGTS